MEIPRTLDDARLAIAPRVVGALPRQIRARGLLAQQQSAIDAVSPVAGDIALGMYLDLPEADIPVSAAMLKSWGISFDEALAIAFENRAEDEAVADSLGVATIIDGIPFAANVVRQPNVAKQIISNEHAVVLIPAPGYTIVGRAGDDKSLEVMLAVADRLLQDAPRTVSIRPIVTTPDGWSEFTWPESLAGAAKSLRRRWESVQYAALRTVLQQHFRATGQSFEMSECVLESNADGNLTTYTTVTEGVPTVIPTVDWVVLLSESGEIARVPWDEISAISDVLQPITGIELDVSHVGRFPAELLA